ncbi:MAG: EAL domain-containing protein [Deltaproteobacteria bacterium]|nr:EAL domain-containing protein [Deltaproteobacteria bacterium]
MDSAHQHFHNTQDIKALPERDLPEGVEVSRPQWVSDPELHMEALIKGDRIITVGRLAYPPVCIEVTTSVRRAKEMLGEAKPLNALVVVNGGQPVGLIMSLHLDRTLSRQFAQRDLTEAVKSVLDAANILPSRIKIEITETALVSNEDQASRTCRALKQHGLLLAIDDFGTGYSSHSHPNSFPFDTLKIDQSFVAKPALGRHRDINIIKTILSPAGALGMTIVAEGVESKEQRDLLLELGCDTGQGYYYSKPMPLDELVGFLDVPRGGVVIAVKEAETDFGGVR